MRAFLRHDIKLSVNEVDIVEMVLMGGSGCLNGVVTCHMGSVT